MDKGRDAKRGAAGRFYRVIAKKSERAKKTRRLSCFNVAESPNKEDCQMGLFGRGNDSSSHSHTQAVVSRNVKNKRFPISKRFFDGINGVDHVAVPRRLRSAMKKCICKSPSPPLPDSKKQNHTLAVGGGESPEKDGMKGALLNFASRSSPPARQAVSDGYQPITKDEEEVVETLFALAGMLHDTKTVVTTELCGEFSGADAPAVPEMGTIPASEIKDNLKDGVAEVVSLNRTTFQEQPGIGVNTMCHTAPDSLEKGMLLSATAECQEENLHSFQKISINNELSVDSTFSQLQPQVISQERMQETKLGARTVESKISKLSVQNITKDSEKNGLTLWPTLSSVVTTSGASHKPSKLADAKIPTWLSAASSDSRPGSLEKFSSRKSSKATVTKKTMKRCATHVHISQLIRALKMPESNDSLSLQAIELNHCEVPKEKVYASTKANRSNRENNEIDVTDITSRFWNFTAKGKFCEHEAASTFIQRKKLLKDPSQIILASGRQSSTKQEFDFLSLSVGSDSIKADKDRNVSGSSSHIYVPYLQSILSLSAQQTLYMSSAHVSKNSVSVPTGQQVKLQLPLHLNSSLYSSFHEKHSGISRQQQQFCAAQSRSIIPSTALNQFPNWLQAKHEHSTGIFLSGQAISPPPPMYMDTISTKYSTVGQHQQPLKATSSLNTERIDKVQERQLAPLYEGGGGGFRLGSVLPLQWLCNESL